MLPVWSGQATYLCAERVLLAAGAGIALGSLERRQPRLQASMALSTPFTALWGQDWPPLTDSRHSARHGQSEHSARHGHSDADLEVDAELSLKRHAVQAVQIFSEQVCQSPPGPLIKEHCVWLACCACANT